MILYSKTYWGLPLLFRLYGSALPRAIPPTLLSALITGLLVLFDYQRVESWWRHPFPYSIFSFIVGFVLVFRVNFAFQRYTSAVSDLESMTSRWRMAVLEMLTFDQPLLDETSITTVSRTHKADTNGHRRDLNGCAEARSSVDRSSLASRENLVNGEIDGVEQFATALVHLASLVHAVSLQILRRDPDIGNLCVHNSHQRRPPSDPAEMLTRMPGDETIGRFSLADMFMLRSSDHHQKRFNVLSPLGIIGGISDEELRLLKLPGTEGTCRSLTSLRPSVVMAWLHQLVLHRARTGGLQVPAPFLSRSFQLLSEGMLRFDTAHKLGNTPLPFPMAQLVLLMVLLHTLACPLVVLAYVRQLWLAIIITALGVFSYWAVNEVSRDIEDPYVYEPNHLPLQKQQHDFNEHLLAMYKALHRGQCYVCLGSLRMELVDDASDAGRVPPTATRHAGTLSVHLPALGEAHRV